MLTKEDGYLLIPNCTNRRRKGEDERKLTYHIKLTAFVVSCLHRCHSAADSRCFITNYHDARIGSDTETIFIWTDSVALGGAGADAGNHAIDL